EPPTRRDFTSRLGFTLSTAFLNTLSGSSPDFSLMMSKLLYRMRSAVLRLPLVITQLMNLLTSGLSYSGSAGMSRFGISRRLGIGDPYRLWALGFGLCRAPYAFFGLFAPYFDRPCIRPWTPTASSVPRTTW